MAVAITTSASGPGAAAERDLFAISGRKYDIYPFTVTFDSSYPTGGESIAASVDADSPYNVLTTVDSIHVHPFVAPGGTGGSTAGHVMTGAADLVNKKIILVDNGSEVADTTNMSLMTIFCVAYGFR